MSIDYIRVYQRKDKINIGCDPADFPTKAYIDTCVFLFRSRGLALVTDTEQRYIDTYTNPNLTTWEQAKQPWPRNRLAQPGQKC